MSEWKARKLTTEAPRKVSAAEYRELEREYGGVCSDCGELQYGSFEPDARGRECEDCGSRRAMGAEWAVVRGLLEVEETEAS